VPGTAREDKQPKDGEYCADESVKYLFTNYFSPVTLRHGGRCALAHHCQENDESRPHHGDVIGPDVKKNFRFGPLRRGKFIFRLIKKPPYYRVDSVAASL
jgi:hypothetical protein